mmetsp:Transcript_2525/g.6031  ORF Transcript_2525/g.6031 Transcript_2525/m.6031 type:complete len:732 (-) Transcript_2525:452-2647(-)|eukprot:CAMPEP_0177642828 /NCGR_PEP_ID=MMETSP0447-20121125/7823_1 /TAXON_ID=0 /ORGANISM="Stygamoeba regulata, Strain BSH-02190019" /LENGTH=731 /DNA_ID=CAMNT_0019145069 /DNA_START=115 /DNA_END=2310 /DNA_ORIENTATION=-
MTDKVDLKKVMGDATKLMATLQKIHVTGDPPAIKVESGPAPRTKEEDMLLGSRGLQVHLSLFLKEGKKLKTDVHPLLKKHKGKLSGSDEDWEDMDYVIAVFDSDTLATVFGAKAELDDANRGFFKNNLSLIEDDDLNTDWKAVLTGVSMVHDTIDAIPTNTPPEDLTGGKKHHTTVSLGSFYECAADYLELPVTLVIIDTDKMSQSHPFFGGRVSHLTFNYDTGTFHEAADYHANTTPGASDKQHGMMTTGIAHTMNPKAKIVFIGKGFKSGPIGKWEKKLFECLPENIVVSQSMGTACGKLTDSHWKMFNSIFDVIERRNQVWVCSQGNDMHSFQTRFPQCCDRNFVVGAHIKANPEANGGKPTLKNMKSSDKDLDIPEDDTIDSYRLKDWPTHPHLFPFERNPLYFKEKMAKLKAKEYFYPEYTCGGAVFEEIHKTKMYVRPVPDTRGLVGAYKSSNSEYWPLPMPMARNNKWQMCVHEGETSGATPQIAMMIAMAKVLLEAHIKGHKMLPKNIAKVCRGMPGRIFNFKTFITLYEYIVTDRKGNFDHISREPLEFFHKFEPKETRAVRGLEAPQDLSPYNIVHIRQSSSNWVAFGFQDRLDEQIVARWFGVPEPLLLHCGGGDDAVVGVDPIVAVRDALPDNRYVLADKGADKAPPAKTAKSSKQPLGVRASEALRDQGFSEQHVSMAKTMFGVETVAELVAAYRSGAYPGLPRGLTLFLEKLSAQNP